MISAMALTVEGQPAIPTNHASNPRHEPASAWPSTLHHPYFLAAPAIGRTLHLLSLMLASSRFRSNRPAGERRWPPRRSADDVSITRSGGGEKFCNGRGTYLM
ncbi:hypothetical protein Salat_0218300 [Sesamum alatum]|uniref:Uncharacterized protein n=1 Tax=Sesamum alatum TaxID=300844 RepID=A0AAE1YYY0_9LAMI|nr:hypothetical protein Salat_0218300 [Sesamum alatum]